MLALPLRRIAAELYPGIFPGTARPQEPKWKRYLRFAIPLLILFALGCCIYYFNTFINLEKSISTTKAQIETQLQRRKNVILSLGCMVASYAKHEKEIFDHTVDVRKEMLALGQKPNPEGGVNAGLEALLSKILAIAEQYPQLRLSDNYQRFMEALVDAENKIAEQRMQYNSFTGQMLTLMGRFPGFMFAKVYGFKKPEYFSSEPDAAKMPKLDQAG
jgi:LemA protein